MVRYERRFRTDDSSEDDPSYTPWEWTTIERVEQMIHDNYISAAQAWDDLHNGKYLSTAFAQYRAVFY